MPLMSLSCLLTSTSRCAPTELVCKQEEEVQQMAQKEEGLVVYQQKVLHDKGSGTKERMKMGLAGRQRINEQTKKFMKKE